MNEFVYAEFAIGDIKKRNKIYDIREFKLNGVRTDCYQSIFLFDKTLDDFVNEKNTVTGFSGPHLAETLVFDFDSDDLERVKDEVYNFVNHLIYNYDLAEAFIRIAFSGSKGFHVSIPFAAITDFTEPSEIFYQNYKRLALKLSEEFNFVDHSIYEPKRLFRMINTINSKSNLYKIPLKLSELKLSIDEIKKLASEPREIEYLPLSEIRPNEILNEIYNQSLNQIILPREKQIVDGNLNKAQEILEILKGGATEGNRHNALIRMTSTLANKGLTTEFILEILKQWNQKNKPPLSNDRLINEMNDVLKNRKVEPVKEVDDIKIYSMSDGLEMYHKFQQEDLSRAVKTGFDLIDKKIRGITPGETMCIIGKTSVGKSAFLQNIGFNYTKQSKLPVLFFSMEMPITSVIERALQIECDMTGFEVEKMFREDKETARKKATVLLSRLPNFYCIEKSGLNLKAIREYVEFAEHNIYEAKTGLILIDYLGLVRENGRDLYEQISKIARGMKELAKDLKVPIIYLSQTTKSYTEYDELSLGSARDSGSVDEASDFILGLWKEKSKVEEISNTETILNCGIIKNRKGGIGKTTLVMNRRNLNFKQNLISN